LETELVTHNENGSGQPSVVGGLFPEEEPRMDINIFNFIRDVLVIGYLFVLRIGVPLLIVVMWGTALRKWLERQSQAQPAKAIKPAEPRTQEQLAQDARVSES